MLAVLGLVWTATAKAAVGHGSSTPNCYVAQNGNDGSGNGTISSPWQTLGKCFSEADPGDTGWFRGGDYYAPFSSCSEAGCTGWGGWGWALGWPQNAAYSATRVGTGGTAGNPVTIRGYPGETARFFAAAGS